MDVLRQWALCVMIAAAAGTLVCLISPRGATDKAVRTVVGIFVVSTICMPLSELDIKEITLPAFAESYENKESFHDSDELIISAFRSETEKAIKSVASQYGVEIGSVSVDASVEDLCIIIHDMRVCIQNINKTDLSDFLKSAEEKLGVPVTITQE